MICYSDIDECASTSICPLGSMCVNTLGSYDCECLEGYLEVDGLCIGEQCFEIHVYVEQLGVLSYIYLDSQASV